MSSRPDASTFSAVAGTAGPSSSSSTVRELLCESGRRGQKNGRGYYTYDPDTRASTPDPEVEQMIRDFAARQGVAQREVTDQEILERCLYPMVNEGAKILEEGIASRASDIYAAFEASSERIEKQLGL